MHDASASSAVPLIAHFVCFAKVPQVPRPGSAVPRLSEDGVEGVRNRLIAKLLGVWGIQTRVWGAWGSNQTKQTADMSN